MFVSRCVQSAFRKAISLAFVSLFITASLAQDAAPQTSQPSMPPLTPMPQAPAPQNNAHLYSDQNYAKPQSPFPNVLAPYRVRSVPPPNLTNSARTDQLFRDGNIYLSINDAVAMALENNLDITIQRYNLSIADTDILLTSSGSAARGVNSGVVSGTPGGATGSTSAGGTGSGGAQGTGAGGTQLGVGGAGAGAAGIVTSTLGAGPLIDNFDPAINGTMSGERATTPQSNIILSGTPTLTQNTSVYNFSYTQGFSTGTLATLGFSNNRITTNSLFTLVSPQINTNFRFTLRQHLLQGFGFDPNLRWIRIARNNREIEDVVFRQQIIQTVSQIENLYWDLVTAYEAVKVNERALQLAEKTLSDNQEQVRIGTLAPITLAQAKSGVATAKQNLISSQTQLQLQQLLMKNAITKNMGDPILAVSPVIPTDTLKTNEQYAVRPVDDLIQEALQARPEIAIARINLTNLEISRKSVKNLLRPTLDLYAFYGATGLAGDQNPGFPDCNSLPPGTALPGQNCLLPGTIPRSGYPNAFHDLFNSSAPDKGIGVNLSIPIRNRQSQAIQVRSDLEYRQSQVLLQQTENLITLQVRNAQFTMNNNYAALQAAIAARDYAQESLTAEQKKFSYGASTPTLVLQASSNLTQAESNVLNAAANYEKSKVQLDLSTAETLSKLGVDIGDAEAGQVKHVPTVKGVVPANPQELTAPAPSTQPPKNHQ
ncbi:MAG TPA: TolC family protein [Terriglobales bacterium]|nr:TolC family protein [Terriglobales bacterium]